MNIKLSGNLVNFYSSEKKMPIYFFKRKELADSRIVKGLEISGWIEHLKNKKWMGKFDLYSLAVLIQKEFPKNTINWEETFYPIEKQDFIKELFEEYERSTLPKEAKKNSLFDALGIKMQLGMEVEKEGKAEVLEKLHINLKHWGLI